MIVKFQRGTKKVPTEGVTCTVTTEIMTFQAIGAALVSRDPHRPHVHMTIQPMTRPPSEPCPNTRDGWVSHRSPAVK